MTGSGLNQSLNDREVSRTESLKPIETCKEQSGRQLTEASSAFKKSFPILSAIELSDHKVPDINNSSTEIASTENGRSVCLELSCRDLDVTLNVKSSDNQDILELTTEVGLLRARLQEYSTELKSAHQEIGFLKAQVLMQKEQLSFLSKPISVSENDFL